MNGKTKPIVAILAFWFIGCGMFWGYQSQNKSKSYPSFGKFRIYNGLTGVINPMLFKIQYGDDGIVWADASVETTIPGQPGGAWTEVTWVDKGRHRYWKFSLTAAPTDNGFLTEIELYPFVGGVVSATKYTLSTAMLTSTLNSWNAANAIDGDTGTNAFASSNTDIAGEGIIIDTTK